LTGGAVSEGERIVAQEPSVVQLKYGRLLMLLRTNCGFQHFSWSKDGGDIWSKAVPSTLRYLTIAALIAEPAALVHQPRIYAVTHTNFNDQEDTFQYRKPLLITLRPGETKTLPIIDGESVSASSTSATAVLRLGIRGATGASQIHL
jgi:hypothetical protein